MSFAFDSDYPWEATGSYVYLYIRLDGRPLYVGKGQKWRWRDHTARRTNHHLWNVIQQAAAIGQSLPVVILEHSITPEEALAAEVKWIASIGRKANGGPLVNLTDGGEGTVGYREPKSPEHRAKIAAANKGRVITQEQRERQAAKLRGRRRSPEAVEKSASGLRGRKPSADVIAARVAGRRAMSPEAKAAFSKAMSRANKGKTLTAETRAKISASRVGTPSPMKGKAHTDDAKEKMRTLRGTPEWRETARLRALAQHAAMTEEQKAARSATISAATKAAMTDAVCKIISEKRRAR